LTEVSPIDARPTQIGAARWAAIVVNYNAGRHLAPCIESMLADDSAGAVEVVVVDNASFDDSLSTLVSLDVSIVHAGANLGYAAAANLGIAASRAPVVAVINPDTLLAHGSAGSALARLDAERDLAAVGPRISNPDGSTYPSARRDPSTVDAIGHALLGAWMPRNRFTTRYRDLNVDPQQPRDVDWLSGAAIWFRRSALDAVGGWDERYFMFLEEVDLCRRLRLGGWRIAYEPSAHLVHEEGVSRAHHPYRMIVAHHRSAWRYAQRWWSGPRRLLLPAAAIGLTLRAVIAMISRRVRAGRPEGRRRRPQVGG
jgi:N-acetylglucosaminyl-diphospho-decaprenol L-rhamnosyltransferase